MDKEYGVWAFVDDYDATDDGIIFDLGLSSDQLENSGRGFSFMKDELLIMTMKANPLPEDVTAQDVVNSWSEESLADIIYGYGEEKYARKIAKGIVDTRQKSKINKILVISLTNIGDVILTFPVIDILKRDFPSANLSVIIGPKAESLLKGNPHLDKVYIFDKHQSPLKSAAWILELKEECFDFVVDLRNTAIPFMIFPRYRTSCRVEKIENQHMREKHLNQLKSIYAYEEQASEQYALFVSDDDKQYMDQLIETKVGRRDAYVVVAPGAADSSKRWPEENFATVCDQLIKDHNARIVFVGSEEDGGVAERIDQLMEADAVNFCGRTSLVQLAELLKRSMCAFVNDSAPMHLASYLDVPVLALFGPTDPSKYGPWSSRSFFLRKNMACPACTGSKTSSPHKCMKAITSEDVLDAFQVNEQLWEF